MRKFLKLNYIKSGVLLITAGVLLCACAGKDVSYHDILTRAEKVDRIYGANQGDAVVIAQAFLIKKGLANRLVSLEPKKIRRIFRWNHDGRVIQFVGPPSVYFEKKIEKVWIIYFKDKASTHLWGLVCLRPLYVEVDAKSGEILKWGLEPD